MKNIMASNGSSTGDREGSTQDLFPQGCQPWNSLVDGVALRIRRSLGLSELLQSSVDEVHHLLGCDRVLIYCFEPDRSGRVAVEAVSDPQWSLVDHVIHDPCFEASWIAPYQAKRYFAVEDIAMANLTPCHAEFLASFDVRANLVIPILKGNTLWGLLIAHQCQASRQWQPIEIEGLQRLVVEIEIAIDQATLLEQLQAAKATLEGEVAARIRELEQVNQALQSTNQKLVEEMRERRMVEVEHLQTQAKLQQLSAIVASSQDAIIGATLQGIVTSWNKAAEAIFGYTAADMVGQPLTTIIPPEHQKDTAKTLRQIRKGQCPKTYETQRLHKNRQRVDVSITVSPIYDENGTIIGASKIVRDITAHKQEERLRQAAELALQDSQQQFESFMRHAPAVTWITDIDGIARYANSRWLDFVGQTAESALGQPIEALFSPEVAQELLRNNQQVIETNAILETTESAPDQTGEIHTFLICKFPIYQDQRITAVGGIGIDITERTKAEAALKESEIRWQFAIEGAGDGLWDWDMQSNTLFFSRQWKAMLGYEDHEIDNRLEEWDSRIHPDDKAQCYVDLERHLKGETEICQSEYRLRCKDGSYKWILDRGKVLGWDNNGQPKRMIGTHTDISDRKAFEVRLQESETTNRAILMAIPDLLLRVDRDGNCHDCLLPQTPYQSTLIPIKQDLSEVLPADSLAQQLRVIETALRENQPQTYEHKIQKDGHLCYEEIRIVPSGAAECLLIVRDITESKQAEEDLRRSEATKRVLMQSIPDLLIRMRQDGQQLEVINIDNVHYLFPEDADITDCNVLQVLPVEIAQERIYLAQCAIETGQAQSQEYSFIQAERTYYEEARISKLDDDEVLVIVRDITNQKEAEARLREREREYRLLVENLPAGVVVHGPKSEILTNNTYASELLGLTTEQMQGKTAIDPAWLFLEEDGLTPMPLENYPINRVLGSGKPLKNQVIGINHPGGSRVVWVLANAYPLHSEDQTIDRVIVTFVDITLQKQVQVDLSQIKDQLELVLQASSEGFWDWDLTTNEIYFSPRWKEMLGYADHELENTFEMWESVIFEEDHIAALQHLEDYNSGKVDKFTMVQRFHHKNGSTVFILSRALHLKNAEGQVLRMVGSHLDITESKHQELALQESEARYRNIIETTLEGVWILDSDGVTTFVNQRMADMLGYEPEAMQGQIFLDFMFPEDRASGQALFSRRQAGIQEQHPFKLCRQDRSELWTLVSGTPVFDSDDSYQGVIGLLTDITPLITTQKALEESEMHLSGILNSSLDGIMAFRSIRNDQGHIIDFEWLLSNATACQAVNKRRDELIGQRLLEVMPGNRTDGLFDLYVQVIETGQVIRRQFHYAHEDVDTWFENIAVPLGDGFVVTFRDISAIKASEKALQASNAALEINVENLRQRNDEMTLLSETSDLLQACRTLSEACAVISTMVKPLFPNCSGSFYITAPSRNRLELVAKWGSMSQCCDDFQPQECWGLRRGRWHHITPDRLELRCNHVVAAPPNLTSLCIPMIAQGETLGLFYLSTDQPEDLSQPKQHLARAVGEQVGLAIANLHLRESLHNQSMSDSLTGLFNRRYLEQTLDNEIARSQRHHYPVAVVMIDVDHFKSFNDQYGHDAGDVVLKEIAQVLKDSVRGSDIVCRYGGEELISVLPETSLIDAVAKAEELRIAIRRLNVTYGGQTLSRITASFGVAVFPDHGSHQAKVIQAADVALYQAKAAGRDRVMAAGGCS